MDKMAYEKLFEPMRIGNVELKNRISMAPMGLTGLATPQGGFEERAVEFFVERARGGAGLLITGTVKVENDIEPFPMPSQPAPLVNPAHFRLRALELTERVHAFDCRIFLQLTMGFGRVAPPTLVPRPVAPSPIPNYWDPSILCRELDIDEVTRLIDAFGASALIARECGFDGIEVHAVHEGYLLDQFALACCNRRTDKYGGDLRGRLTAAREVRGAIARYAGEDFPVMLRYTLKSFMKGWRQGGLPGEEFQEFGRDMAEGLEAGKILEESGYDAFNADAGTYESWYWAHPPVYLEEGCYLPYTEALKGVVSVPVIAAGKLGDPDRAERALREGRADGVSLGRPLLADPAWPLKVRRRDVASIRPCIGCHDACMNRIAKGKPLSCTVNPATGREREFALTPARERRRIAVVGGGIAGMEAARVAALRGHAVVLFEGTGELGGHVIEGSVPEFKRDDRRLLAWYRRELERGHVDVRLHHRGDRAVLDAVNPDAVVVATGSLPLVPPLGKRREGAPEVLTAQEALRGERPLGRRLVVLGGGFVGCELAVWFTQQGHEVELVEVREGLMTTGDVPHPNRIMLLDLLTFHRVGVWTGARLSLLAPEGATIQSADGERLLPCDTLVLATGYRSDRGIWQEVSGAFPEAYLVGDALRPANVQHAVWTAYEVARQL